MLIIPHLLITILIIINNVIKLLKSLFSVLFGTYQLINSPYYYNY